jgi:hypothetical protein
MEPPRISSGDALVRTTNRSQTPEEKNSGHDLVYHYKLIEGTVPKAGGATALFIDWIGVGGGVGVGFHGVGAGARGVGLR